MNALIPLLSILTAGPLATSEPVGNSTEATAPAVEAVRFEVDHSALLEEQMAAAAEDSAFFVEQDGAKELTDRHGVDVVEDAAVPAIVVKLAWKDYEHSVYSIEIGVERVGESYQAVETFEATCINNSALTAAVIDKLPAVLSKLTPPEPDAPDWRAARFSRRCRSRRCRPTRTRRKNAGHSATTRTAANSTLRSRCASPSSAAPTPASRR